MTDDVQDLIDRVRRKYLSSVQRAEQGGAVESLADGVRSLVFTLVRHRWLSLGALAILALLSYGVIFLLEDYLTKRQAYPIRNVLYQCNETVSISGTQLSAIDGRRDRDAKTIIQKGNNDGTKLGEILGIFKMETTDEGRQYQLEDKDKTRFAYAVEKTEPVQAGLSLRGALDFRETYSQIIGSQEKYLIYTIIPERGARNIQVHVLADANNNKHLINRLTTLRSIPLGVLWGTDFRAGTVLDEFVDNPSNGDKEKQVFTLIDQYQSAENQDIDKRQAMIERILELIDSMETVNIYISYEDGIIDYFPQESSTYLFHSPTMMERVAAFFGAGKHAAAPASSNVDIEKPFIVANPAGDVIRIRVENHRDRIPGNYWVLNQIAIGDPPNVVRPFAHTNNGGYTIEDQTGVIGEIKIEDFFLHYGDDLLYTYYLDLDGNGEIDYNKENIGQVLFRVHHDDRSAATESQSQTSVTNDTTLRYSYSFMAGINWNERQRDFYLCNTIESFVVNELNRGFGKHSDLGWINNQRSNIRLLEQRELSNLARAMSAESALVAKQDIVALLRAAKRDYVNSYIKSKEK